MADAIVCLDYIDHDFYVFRNVDTAEINVVYKVCARRPDRPAPPRRLRRRARSRFSRLRWQRNSGGVGLIEPERDFE